MNPPPRLLARRRGLWPLSGMAPLHGARRWLAGGCAAVVLALAGPGAWAQSAATGAAQAEPSLATPSAPASGIQHGNILDITDAASQPGYAEQTNAQRREVQPGNNAPMWRQVGQGTTGVTNFPYPEYGTLIQPFVQYPGSAYTNAGEAWRQVRNRWILPYGGSLLLIVLLALAIFYFGKGPLLLHGAETGRKIERFTAFERAAHWANAAAFVALAGSGIVMAFGQFFLLPVIGTTLFGWLTYALKNLHNFTGPLFAVSLVVVILTFVKDNLPRKEDLTWLLKGGGLLGAHEVPSHRFNAGEKVLFWGGVFLFGLVVVGSGLVLDKVLPSLAYLRADMQLAHMVHASAAVVMVVMFMGHIYMGTIGMQGAYQAMKTGYVDETWAKEHHELWHDDIQAGKIPAVRSVKAEPGAGIPAAGKA